MTVFSESALLQLAHLEEEEEWDQGETFLPKLTGGKIRIHDHNANLYSMYTISSVKKK